jgi:hypothetical protein
MKTLLLPAIAAFFLLPIHSADAKGKTFGGFKANYKFNLKVEEVISFKSTGIFGKPQKAPIPNGVPKYKKGQKVKFKIGNKGELIAKGASIPFLSDGGTSNVYNKVSTGTNPKTDTATVYKDADNKASGAALSFIRISGSPFNLTTYTLTYTLR